MGEIHHSETSDNWHRPGVDPKKMKTEVFFLPSAQRIEKEGTVSNSGRWLQWFDKAVEPAGEARDFGDMLVPLINKIRDLYRKEGGTFPDPILGLNWCEKYKAEEWTKRINGVFWKDTKVKDKVYHKGQSSPPLVISRLTVPLPPSTGCTATATQRKTATRPRTVTSARPPSRPLSACIPSGPGAGRSTAACSITAPPWIPMASPGIRSVPSSGGMARRGRVISSTVEELRLPIRKRAACRSS